MTRGHHPPEFGGPGSGVCYAPSAGRYKGRHDLHRETKSSVSASLGSPDKMPTVEQPLELTGCFWKASDMRGVCLLCTASAHSSLWFAGVLGSEPAPDPLPHRHSCSKGIEILAKARFCPREAGEVEES